jgi:8-oxo-dGTP pyrophosphatase MutT (NUDIX family)
MDNPKSIKSYGIMLLNFDADRKLKVLIVQKRNTYGYIDFIHVRYKKNDNNRLRYLFDNMTTHEKLDILSLDFDRLMYKYNLINLGADEQIFKEAAVLYKRNKYSEWKRKFEQNFNNAPGRKRLKSLINSSSSIADMWEIPRGRKLNLKEKNLNCAIREFYEETRIPPSEYDLIPDEHFVLVQSDDGIDYVSYYYVAVCKDKDLAPKINYNNYAQISEITDIKFELVENLHHYNISSAKNMQNYLRKLRSQLRCSHLDGHYSRPLVSNETSSVWK